MPAIGSIRKMSVEELVEERDRWVEKPVHYAMMQEIGKELARRQEERREHD